MWMDLDAVIESEVSQKEKNKHHILTHIWGIRKNTAIDNNISGDNWPLKLKICEQRWQAKVGEYLSCMEQDEWSHLAGEQSPRNGDMKDKTLEGIVVEL